MWDYDDIHRAVIQYYQRELRQTDLDLNFSVIALSTDTPRALVRFTLYNNNTSQFRQWTTVLAGERIQELKEMLKQTINDQLQYLPS